jgi:pimeloyl-ACP methyl ester carboxylesterase
MIGKNSPLSSRAAAQRLMRVLPRVEVVELDGLGHMGPVTHADAVNPVIRRFLERISQ